MNSGRTQDRPFEGHDHHHLIDGSYELVSVIGRGGNSIVYAARPTEEVRKLLNLPELVTLKLFNENASSPELIQRIQREALCIKAIDNPGVIKLYDYSASLELSYLVLEYAGRGDVKGLMEDRGTIDPATVLHIAVKMLEALEAVHEAKILHRDVKPENLLVTKDGSLRLSDFGVSTFITEDSVLCDSDEIVRGTLGYIAPEQLQGLAESQATDIFAAAVSIFEMLTGRLPYEGNSLTALLDAMLEGRALSITSILGKKFAPLEELLTKGLAPNPANRFASAVEFRTALNEIIPVLELSTVTTIEISPKPKLEPSKASKVESESIPANPIIKSSRKKRNFKLVSGLAIAVLILGIFFASKESATANLRRTAPQSGASQSDPNSGRSGVFSWFGKQQKPSAYNQVKILSTSAKAGVLYNFLGDGKNVFFSTTPVTNNSILGSNNKFLFSISLPGWRPQLVTLSPNAKSRELLIAAGGMRIMLEVAPVNRESEAEISGRFKDLSTGRESRWAIF